MNIWRSAFLILAAGLLLSACGEGNGIPPEQVFITPMIAQPLPTEEKDPPPVELPELNEPLPVLEKTRIPYTENKTLDVYYPDADGSWPVVVALHGGGGSSRGMADIARATAGQGAVVFVPNFFTIPPDEELARSYEESACSIRYALSAASDYRGDPERLIIIGYSGGGAVGSVLMFSGNDFQSEDCLVSDGDIAPEAFLGLDGAYDITRYLSGETLAQAPEQAWLKLNPFSYVHQVRVRTEAHFVLVYGMEEELHQQAQLFRDALSSVGYEVDSIYLRGYPHTVMKNGGIAEIDRAIRMLLDG